jgi:hypothetical protein
LQKSKSGSVLEKLRASKKEAKQFQLSQLGQLKEGAFILPNFKTVQSETEKSLGPIDNNEDVAGTQQVTKQYQQKRKEKQLTYNHYCNVSQQQEIDLQPQLVANDD